MRSEKEREETQGEGKGEETDQKKRLDGTDQLGDAGGPERGKAGTLAQH